MAAGQFGAIDWVGYPVGIAHSGNTAGYLGIVDWTFIPCGVVTSSGAPPPPPPSPPSVGGPPGGGGPGGRPIWCSGDELPWFMQSMRRQRLEKADEEDLVVML